MMVQRPDWVAGKGLRQDAGAAERKGSAKLNGAGVPRTGDFAKSPEDRQLLDSSMPSSSSAVHS